MARPAPLLYLASLSRISLRPGGGAQLVPSSCPGLHIGVYSIDMTKNKHGLRRDIPEPVKRKVRRRSRFGCVICRCAYYTYEHIDPPFSDATAHRADDICCLCASCHLEVTVGRCSKQRVRAAYDSIWAAPPKKVPKPVGPVDFSDGSAYLAVGGLRYSPAVHCVFRYMGSDVFRLAPSRASGEPGGLYAAFSDDEGEETLTFEGNAWTGSLKAWDIEVKAKKLVVRRKSRHVVLSLRLEPPGLVVIERLDMRHRDVHLLVSEHGYTIGRYKRPDSPTPSWVHAELDELTPINVGGSNKTVAIEVCTTQEIRRRDEESGKRGLRPSGLSGNDCIPSPVGMLFPDVGISIGSFPGRLAFMRVFTTAPTAVEKMRKNVFDKNWAPPIGKRRDRIIFDPQQAD